MGWIEQEHRADAHPGPRGKWKVLRGLHSLRHSFISCLAAAGVDQRIIDELVGHQTPEQQKRYRHIFPSVKFEAVHRVFG